MSLRFRPAVRPVVAQLRNLRKMVGGDVVATGARSRSPAFLAACVFGVARMGQQIPPGRAWTITATGNLSITKQWLYEKHPNSRSASKVLIGSQCLREGLV